jgi:hypothetical protein
MRGAGVITGVFLAVCVCSSSRAESDVLRYKLPQRPVIYTVTIHVDAPSEQSTYQGRITYEGRSDTDGKLALAFKGGLKETKQSKNSSRSSTPAMDPFGGAVGRAGPASPFARSAGPGSLRQTDAQLTISATGEALTLQGDSQLPLPLGHLSLLVFETLPDAATATWTTTDGVLLGRPSERPEGFPGDPFTRPARPGQTSAGSETARFKIAETSGSLVKIIKDYALQSPNTTPAFELTGGGSLVFDRNQGWFASANLKYALKAKSEGSEATIPVTVEYKQLSAEEIEREQQDRTLAELDLRRKDAAGGCDGIKNGSYGFHTDKQQDPWWQVDLGRSVNLAGAIIFNRCIDKDMEKRADRIRILVSDDGKSWTQVYAHSGPSFFGYSDNKPLKVPLPGKTARFVRVQVPIFDYFHLDEVEVYEKGNPENIALRKPAEQSSVSMRHSNFDK